MKRGIGRRFIRGVITVAAIASFSCAPAPRASAQAPVNVKVGVADLAIFSNFPIELADNLGYFKDEGLNVEVIGFKTGPQTVQAVIAGQVQFAFNGIDQVVNVRSAGKDVKVVGTSMVALGMQVVAAPGITTVQQLQGHALGVSSFGSGTDIAMEYILHKYNVPSDAGTFVPVGLSDSFLAAFATHHIDAGITSAPWTTYAVKKGLGHVLVDLDSPAVTRSIYGGPYPFNCLWATTDYINQNQPIVEKMVRAMTRAVHYAQTTPFEQLKPHVPKVMIGDDPETSYEGLQKMIAGMAPTPVVSLNEAQRAVTADAAVIKGVAAAVQSGQLKAEDVIDMRAALKVAKEMKLPASPE